MKFNKKDLDKMLSDDDHQLGEVDKKQAREKLNQKRNKAAARDRRREKLTGK